MEPFFAALAKFAVRFKYPVVIAWIVVTIVSVAVFPGLSSVTKDQNSSFLPASAPSMKASKLAAPWQNVDFVSANIVASRENGPLSPADQTAIGRLMAIVKTVPHVKTVQDQGISGDGKARQIQFQADVDNSGTGDGKTVTDSVRGDFKKIGAPAGLNLHLGGDLGIIVDEATATSGSEGQTTYFSYLFILVLLLVAFRALLAPLVTLLPAALVLMLSGPVIAASTHLGVQVGSITQIILIVLILGAGTDYGLFLVFRVREELRNGSTTNDAVVHALTNVGETISFSAFTVIAAMMSLLLSQFGFYQGMGPALAIGIGLMLLAGLTFLPAILAIFGRAVFWPSHTTATASGEKIGIWGSVAVRVVRRPIVTVVTLVALFGVLALGIVNSGTTGFGDTATGPKGSDSAAAQAAILRHYPESGNSVQPTLILFRFNQPVWSQLQSLTALQGKLATDQRFVPSSLSGPLNPNGIPLTPTKLAQLHQQLGPAQDLPAVQPVKLNGVPAADYNAYRATFLYISADGTTAQWITELKDNNTGSTHDLNEMPALNASIDAIGHSAGATQTGVFSQMSFSYDVSNLSSNDLRNIIPFVSIVIAILLAIVLRSLFAPLYLVASVVLSYLAALGFAAYVFVHFGSNSGLNFVLPFLVFIFITALGSDYNILIMTRIREEARKRPLRQAVAYAVGVSGSTITTAGTILAGTFAVLALAAGSASGADQVRQIGYGIAAGVLLDTFLIRTLLVPAFVTLLGRWNWWPSKLYRQPIDEQPDTVEGVA
jgi:RND superfamily putative drug exporter